MVEGGKIKGQAHGSWRTAQGEKGRRREKTKVGRWEGAKVGERRIECGN
jgi:hypothetical protein